MQSVAELITALAALGALIVSIVNGRKIQAVHIDIDGRMDQLLKSTGIASRAEGVEQGRKDALVKGQSVNGS